MTHQRQYLPQCDRVLVLREGRVHAAGTPAELAPRNLPELQATDGALPALLGRIVKALSSTFHRASCRAEQSMD